MQVTRAEWLAARKNGIGASEAAAVIGKSPYMSNERLWEIKTGRRQAEDISSKPYVEYGTRAEPHLRALFALDYPQYRVEHEENEIIWNPRHEFLFASPDGKLTERATGRRGGLEIKTTEIFNPSMWGQWEGQVPDHYFIQILHQMLAADWEFVWLKAQIKFFSEGAVKLQTRHYLFERENYAADLEYLLKAECAFWDLVKKDRRPGRLLPEI